MVLTETFLRLSIDFPVLLVPDPEEHAPSCIVCFDG